MTEPNSAITPITIENELKQSYLDYAMSVIVGRALPDVRDGLKPVHRRVLYSIQQLKTTGISRAEMLVLSVNLVNIYMMMAVYDITRMAQPFSLRYVG